jgi:hypothetical protein
VFLHYVLDLWLVAWRKRHAVGQVIIVRYADDFVLGFREEIDAKRCLGALKERFTKFGLELHPEKTRLIEFGRYAAERRSRRGDAPPETFDFLGFTHICGKTRKGDFTIKRISAIKKLRSKVKELKVELRKRMHMDLAGTDQKNGASFGHRDGTILTLAGLCSVSVRAGACSSRGLLKTRSDGFGR